MIPLSSTAKSEILAGLEKLDKNDPMLIKAIVEAAINQFSFPEQVGLAVLQASYQQDIAIPEIKAHNEKGFELAVQFKCAQKVIDCATSEKIDNWNDQLLLFLAKKLGIKFKKSPYVQATILNGKVYWRLKYANNKIVNNERFTKNNAVQFTDENSWVMSWERFRQFKDSGKLTSSVRITEKRFTASFPDEWKNIAPAVWADLHEIGVLNKKHKLSREWYALSAVTVELKALKKRGVKVTYSHVVDTLYKIVNNKENAEKNVAGIANFNIFRPALIQKKWSDSANITNARGAYHTKEFDVSTYGILCKHTARKSDGPVLNNDHIPSAAALRQMAEKIEQSVKDQIEILKANIEAVESEIDRKESNEIKEDTDSLDNEIVELQDELTGCQSHLDDMKKLHEYSSHGGAMSIAILKSLHVRGSTYAVNTDAQNRANNGEHSFLCDTRAYMDILSKEESFDYQWKMLGSLRYMYSSNNREYQPIAGKYPIGNLSHTLFNQDANKLKNIDKFFIEEAKRITASL